MRGNSQNKKANEPAHPDHGVSRACRCRCGRRVRLFRFLEIFTAQIRNPPTRRAYARAAMEFLDWLETKGVTQITAIESVHVAAYVEQLQKARSAPTAKLRLAALRQSVRLLDRLIADHYEG